MRFAKKIWIVLLLIFIAIQFVQPGHNTSGQVASTDLMKVYNTPQIVNNIIHNACYDCHSNNTNYPWYSFIQPVAWMMNNHIKSGKDKLNLSEFGDYSLRKQKSKLQGILNSIKDCTMPISSYALMHKESILSKGDKENINIWIQHTIDSLRTRD